MQLRLRIAFVAIIALLVFAAPLALRPDRAVSETPRLECGSNVTPEEAAAFRARWAGPQPVAQIPANGSYCVPIAAHIVRKSDGTGGLPLSQLDQAMLDANSYFADTGISFYLLSVDYIDDDDYYYNVNTNAEINALKGENVVADAINIYFTENLSNENGGLCGLSSFTTSAVQGIAMANDCTGLASNPSSYPHEIGHYFDLYHTHETAFGAELVDGTNCGAAGDLLCDTPADPTLVTGGAGQNIDTNCNYYGTETDANGDSYNPDTSQLMSYAFKTCRTTMSPQSEARALATLLAFRANHLNRGCPPVANAGADVTAECAGTTTTPVALDGTASSDPDGDPLTYAWAASGVTFNDATSATPTGGFAYGTTEVVLTVTDDIGLSDTDTMYVTVEDTTDPTISCPADITVECVDFCGVPKTDAQLAAFFAGVSASDICCGGVVEITNDAPACFELGTTAVIFTAEDCHGNTSQCSSWVTVEDTTPPEIDVVIDRDVLWPPNPKMADIYANVTVSDICCAVPTYVLTSITSDEPDNDKGDGNTVDDIQGASYGTPDLAFQLRSERSGKGDGRVYTAIYTATDCSGNTASDTAYVRVPHDHSGLAFASMGFVQGGLNFEPALDEFVIIIPSREAVSTTGPGGQTIVQDAFDATALDVSRTYIGNVKGVVVPVDQLVVDNNADGLEDLALYYSAQAVNAIVFESTKTDGEQISLEDSYGAIGLHYVTPDGVDYLVANIFQLGEPVPLVPTITIGRTDETLGEPRPEGRDVETPAATGLGEIYPNPFNPTTTVPFVLTAQTNVRLAIFDAQGKLVRTLTDESLPAGTHSVVWDGRDNSGSQAATGVYFVRLIAGSFEMTKKVVMLK